MGGVRDRPGRAQPTSGIWSLRHLPRLSGVGRVDAVELARLAGRLSVLVPPLAAGWVWQRQQLPISWGTAVDRANVAVGRTVAVDLKPLSGRNSTMWICSAPKPRSKSS